MLRLQLLGFDWKNCGKDEDPAVLKSLSVSPDPITIPGDVTASASGSTAVELSAPLSVGYNRRPLTKNQEVEILTELTMHKQLFHT